MSYRELLLRSDTPEGAVTEIMYEIASARVDFIDLVKFEINTENIEINKYMQSIIKALKAMKQKGTFQFFATKESFEDSRTEAVFLQNKYPHLFDGEIFESPNRICVYIKL